MLVTQTLDQPTTKAIRQVSIIGAGKVGSSMARLCALAGFDCTLIGRDIEQQKSAVKVADLVILSVSDDAITACSNTIASALSPGTLVVHCSGSSGSDLLRSAQQNGALTASCHPLMTFSEQAQCLKQFASLKHATPMFAEGQVDALTALRTFFLALGFRFHEIDSRAKVWYHLASVIACNYLTVLISCSRDLAEQAGINDRTFWQAFMPIIQQTLVNNEQLSAYDALSGPIKRGDTGTVTRHLNALSEHQPKLEELYRELGKHALELTKQHSNPNPRPSPNAEQWRKMESILQGSAD